MTSLGGYAVDKIIVNGLYNKQLNDYDVAMMRLTKPLTIQGRIGGRSIHSLSNKHATNYFGFKYLLSTGTNMMY